LSWRSIFRGWLYPGCGTQNYFYCSMVNLG
jgi:hypothetical protein